MTAVQLATPLVQLGLVLLVALLMGRLAGRLGMPAVLGELTAGIALAPSMLPQVAPVPLDRLVEIATAPSQVVAFAGQVGVLLLVGLAGMHIDLGLVRRSGATAARVSLGGLLVPLLLGSAGGYLLPASLMGGSDRAVFALFIAVALSVSAIPVIAKTLIDMRLMHRDVGQLTLCAAMVDDAAGWMLLAVVSGLATTGLTLNAVALSLLPLAVIVAFTLVAGCAIVRTTIAFAARSGRPAVLAVTVAALVLASAEGARAIGSEPIVGAFACGLLVGSRTTIDAACLAGLRVPVVLVLAPIFFMTAGLRMDVGALARPDVALAAAAVIGVAIAGKFVGAYIGARLSRLGRWEAIALGAGLNARGVIEVVIATAGLEMGVLNTDSYTILLLVAIATSLMAPPLLRFAARRIPQTDEEQRRGLAFAV